MQRIGRFFLDRPLWVTGLIVMAIAALPVAVWLDLRNLSDQNLVKQAQTLNRVISIVRSYYADNVVGRITAADGRAHPMNNYEDRPGGIPIPATLSIELGDALGGPGGAGGDVDYRFVSAYPFANRAAHRLDAFERSSLASFERTGGGSPPITRIYGNLWNRTITLAVPVVMGAACVSCHNAHPESPKQDWRVGDVRGIQSVSVQQPIALNIWSFRWLLGYLIVAGCIGMFFALIQFRLAREFHTVNEELESNNTFLADISTKLSRYLSPQIYRLIFSGEKAVDISTDRKKLTVFFSDIKDFTATTERLQPEELTELLNEYFREMSAIAETHGATIDKFIGDAIVAFMGDPTTLGVAEDARACVRMALDMQRRLAELNQEWRQRGHEHPFRARIGINTGYCNVGNFGSDTRMDYTIIGAEANLAARMESIAEPGGIVMSYETWAHARDLVEANALEPTTFKGIAREVTPYKVVMPDFTVEADAVIHEREPGLEVFINPRRLTGEGRGRARAALRRALAEVGGDGDGEPAAGA